MSKLASFLNLTAMLNSTQTQGTSTTEYLVIAGNILVGGMTLFNNCLLLVTLSTNRSLWSYINAYIASLADLLLGLMLFIRNFWLFPNTERVFENRAIACLPVTCLVYISAMESLACLVLMSADRYLYIVHPFWYELKITHRVTHILIALSWCVSTSLGILPMWLNNFTPKLGCQPMLIISKSYLLGCLCVYFLVASVAIAFMYGRVFCVWKDQRRRIDNMAAQVSRTRRESSRWQVIRFLLLVCGLFFLCWLPLVVSVIFYFTLGINEKVISITVSIAAFYSCLNLYVYMAMSENFKTAVLRIVCFGNGCRGKTSMVTGEVSTHGHVIDSAYRVAAVIGLNIHPSWGGGDKMN